jgi:hypothetical protein
MKAILMLGLAVGVAFQALAQTVSVTQEKASIGNARVAIEVDLKTGTYSGFDQSDHTAVFRDAWYRIGQGGWKEPQ